MNLTKIFDMQKELDKAIEKAHKIKSKDIRDKRIVALIVEVGEFANEYAPFKYWKKNKKIIKEKVLEEFVDGIHFLSSMAIELKTKQEIHEKIVSRDLSEQLSKTFESIVNLFKSYNKESLVKAFSLYLGNAKLLGISNEEILENYVSKNKVNYERIANNY